MPRTYLIEKQILKSDNNIIIRTYVLSILKKYNLVNSYDILDAVLMFFLCVYWYTYLDRKESSRKIWSKEIF